MNIKDLPNEMLIQICESMDLDSLLNLTIGYKRAYEVCYDTVQKKKESERIRDFIDKFNYAVNNDKRFFAHKQINNNKAIVSIIPFSSILDFTLSQGIRPWNKKDMFPWILPEINYEENTTYKRGGIEDSTLRISTISKKYINSLLNNLINQGYYLGL